ncbi:response regulator [Oharaeibacter diazotrophicus]|uniref:Winged helix family two component transcriptional regulator n=1 Tax=Oharaeibacter diazotrophicus TaxID=1920512 RepID=A0A4R6RBV9_9HYPH|nr:response regulator [Oharaeibacter diazotrophicus]TDP83157.1 winged helix family two component transcriptional regulator [Oharaeibacter diazotrophicus]BBE71987.1 response regulator receiver protein, MxbM [Pleomorphomonas sp. SM30]GLS78750.1 DNA-binding response regulator [Oharaeibacter diazotrophicus]
MTTVLLVDDEQAIHRFLRPALAAEGYEVLPAKDGREALALASERAPDVVILDLGLPDIDGKVVLRRLRAWSDVPVVILSARDREAEKVEALDLGADDFVNKPFGVGELLARLRAALRKHRPGKAAPTVLRAGRCEIDLAAHRVTLAGEEVRLTRREFDLLALLARNAGTVLTHRQLLTAVWGPSHAGDTQYLRVYVGQIRQKLGASESDLVILTEPGIGYRIATDAG